ncbi:MAG: universal stress protein [Candidatus Bipolaricaulia bacterium]
MNEKNKELSLAEFEYDDVLISVANPENAKQLVKLAKLITTSRATFHIMNVTRDKSFPERERSWRQGTELVMDTTHYAQRLGRTAAPLASTSSSIPKAILNAVENVEAGLVIMGWFGRITPVAVRRSSVVNKVLHKAPCDVGVFKSRNTLEEVSKVVMPVGPSNPRHKRLAIVDRLLNQTKAEGKLIHILTPDTGENANEKALERLNEVKEMLSAKTETSIINASSVLQGLLSGSQAADLIVIGPGREWVFDRFLFGRTADNLTNRVDTSVLMFKGSEHKMVAWSRGLLKALTDLAKRPFS